MDDQLQRRADDNRASEPVNWNGVATPLPDSSIVYLARHRANDTNTWIELKTQEELADAHRSPNEIELRTLFAVPVADLARSPVSIVMRARVALDGLERRIAKAERRIDDRRPSEPLQWDDCPDLLEMKAAANELQSAVERASTSSLHFMQVRTEDVAAAVSYTKYLANLAGAVQAGRCRAQGGDTNEEAAGVASQSQAVPSELASLQTYEPGRTAERMDMYPVNGGDWVKLSDVQSLFSHSAATGKVPEAVVKALRAIVDWKLPATGSFWDDGSPMSYGAAYGSNGERDYMRQVASDALDLLAASPAAPLAGKAPSTGNDQIDSFLAEYEIRGEDGDGYSGVYSLTDHDRWVIANFLIELDEEMPFLSAPLAAAVPAEEAEDDQEFDRRAEQLTREMGLGGGKINMNATSVMDIFVDDEDTPAEPAPIQSSALTIDKDAKNQNACAHCKRLPGDPDYCDWSECPAGVVAPTDVLTNERIEVLWRDAEIFDFLGFARAIEREVLARLSKPTAQGTAPQQLAEKLTCGFCKGTGDGEVGISGCTDCNGKGYVWEPVGPSPAQVTGEPASIDTPEFRKALCAVFGVKDIIYAKALPALVAVINRHIASQATAGRDAQGKCRWTLDDEENGIWQSSCGEAWSFVDGGPVENRVLFCQGCGKAVELPAPHAAEQSSGGAK